MGLLFRLALVAALTGSALSAVAADLVQPLPIEAKIPRSGHFIGFGFGSVWLMSGSRLARIDPADNSVADTPIEGTSGRFRAYQVAGEAVWLPDIAADLLFRFDPATNEVTLTVPVDMDLGEGSIGVGLGSVWVMEDGASPKSLLRINTEDGSRLAGITLPGDGAGVWVAFGSVWVTAPQSDEIYRIDPGTNSVVQVIPSAAEPRFLTSDEQSVWVAAQSGYLQRINGRTGEVEATIETGLDEGGGDIDAGGGYVWLNALSLAVMQVDPNTNKVVARFHKKYLGDSMRYGAESLWITGDELSRVRAPR